MSKLLEDGISYSLETMVRQLLPAQTIIMVSITLPLIRLQESLKNLTLLKIVQIKQSLT